MAKSKPQKLQFLTADGVCGYTCEWDAEGAKWDAERWVAVHGDRIGSGNAQLPNGQGWIDLAQFATVLQFS